MRGGEGLGWAGLGNGWSLLVYISGMEGACVWMLLFVISLYRACVWSGDSVGLFLGFVSLLNNGSITSHSGGFYCTKL